MEQNVRDYLTYTLAKEINMLRKYGKSNEGSHKAHVSKAKNTTHTFVSEANISHEDVMALRGEIQKLSKDDFKLALKPVKKPVVKIFDVEDAAPPQLYRYYEKSVMAYNGLRDFEILAMYGNKMMVELFMPSGKTYLRLYTFKDAIASTPEWMSILMNEDEKTFEKVDYTDVMSDHHKMFKSMNSNEINWMGIKNCGKKKAFEFYADTYAEITGTKTTETYFVGCLHSLDDEPVILHVAYQNRKRSVKVLSMSYCKIGKRKFETVEDVDSVFFTPHNRMSPDDAKANQYTLKK